MLKYKDIRKVHIEVSDICNAACPMCARFQGGGVSMFPYLTNTSMSIFKFKELFQKSFVQQIQEWLFCGVYGDPCTAVDLPKIISYIKSLNPDVFISVESNGGIRDTQWWSNLASSLNSEKCSVSFSIDGLEDTNHIYRRNVKWNKLLNNIRAFTKAGGYSEWQFIKFKHNQHKIDTAKVLAKELGIKTFNVKETNRFRRLYDNEYKFP